MALRRELPRMGLLLMGVAILLASAGVGYGLWSKSLLIEGTVDTGNVDAEWVGVVCRDTEPKDVGDIQADIDSQDPQVLRYVVSNGYPGYCADCQVDFLGTGSVPVRVEHIDFYPGLGLTHCVVTQSPMTGSFIAECDQLQVTWMNSLCAQLHSGDPPVASSLRTEVRQGAAMGALYTFDVEVLLVQYNESGCP